MKEERWGLTAVDPDRAGTETTGHGVDDVDVLSPEAGCQAEGAGVGALDDFLNGLELQDGLYRPEDLVRGDLHVVLWHSYIRSGSRALIWKRLWVALDAIAS